MNIKDYVIKEKKILKKRIQQLKDDKKLLGEPQLHIVQVGDLEASNRYVRNKVKDAQELGIKAIVHKVSGEDLSDLVKEIDSPLIIQLPLPNGIEIPKISPWQDVDGFGAEAQHVPCTPGGIIDYLDAIGFEWQGKFAVVIGRSDIVGKPMAKMLQDKDCTVAVVHSKTREGVKKSLLLNADLVICAVGQAEFLDPKECPKAFIVDVGINFNEAGELVGDVCKGAPERTTPVPGGVGLLTRLKLMKNVVDCYS